jgi:hypothetical protein
LILEKPSSYWESGCGDAAIRYTDNQGYVFSQMIFLLRDPTSIYLKFFPSNDVSAVMCHDLNNLQLENEVTVTHGGSPLILPMGYFIDRQTAVRAVSAFIYNGDGVRLSGFNWLE